LRIAVISDIHSNLDAFEKVISNLPQHDKLLCLGDIVGYGPQPNEVIEQLRQLEPAIVLLGNHDHAVVTGDTSDFSPHAAVAVEWTRTRIEPSNLSYLSQLQPSAQIQFAGNTIGLYHGSPSDPLSEYIYPGMPASTAKGLVRESGAQIVLLGHTHVPMFYILDGEVLGNPGSVGQPRDGDPRASFAILTISSDEKPSFEVKRVDYDVEKVADRILREGLPTFLADRLYTGM
jgi:putative phosphoesterase